MAAILPEPQCVKAMYRVTYSINNVYGLTIHQPTDTSFFKLNQLGPWIKDQGYKVLLSIIVSQQLKNFATCGSDKQNHEKYLSNPMKLFQKIEISRNKKMVKNKKMFVAVFSEKLFFYLSSFRDNLSHSVHKANLLIWNETHKLLLSRAVEQHQCSEVTLCLVGKLHVSSLQNMKKNHQSLLK